MYSYRDFGTSGCAGCPEHERRPLGQKALQWHRIVWQNIGYFRSRTYWSWSWYTHESLGHEGMYYLYGHLNVLYPWYWWYLSVHLCICIYLWFIFQFTVIVSDYWLRSHNHAGRSQGSWYWKDDIGGDMALGWLYNCTHTVNSSHAKWVWFYFL